MRQYIIRRVLISLLVLLGVSMLLYALVRSMPADFVTISTSTSTRMTDEMRDALRASYGLDKSIPAGYVNWLIKALQGDLGNSLIHARPVTEVISGKIGITFGISALALLFELLIGIPLGILAARKRNTATDYTITIFVFLGISVPSFFLAALLKYWFGFYGLNILPTAGLVDARAIYNGFSIAKLLDYARHLIMPITVFTFVSMGEWLRYTRSNMIETIGSDYVRTARAKGVPEHKVIYSHAFRNTLIPIVTLLGASLPSLFSGAIITENLFGIPGMGSMLLEASQKGDVPLLMAACMFLAVCTVVGYLISDILYAVVDPRIRLS
ncbi:ABC transporter permease [Ruminococcaceae bacterium OttesenSCG-928-D13]|nr:ABC transporter permease [Ruminococcaceae bacterium OttesenSCG-928-D13]